MKIDEYLVASERTAASPDHIRVRITEDSMRRLVTAFHCFRKWGEVLDSLKKEIFYGKEPTPWEPALPTVLDGELSVAGTKIVKDNINLLHGILGKATEVAEIVDLAIDLIQKGEVDFVNLMEELGDDCWYDALILREVTRTQDGKLDLEAATHQFHQNLEVNIRKLKKRFPEKFTEHSALNRDIDSERQLLEEGHDEQRSSVPTGS